MSTNQLAPGDASAVVSAVACSACPWTQKGQPDLTPAVRAAAVDGQWFCCHVNMGTCVGAQRYGNAKRAVSAAATQTPSALHPLFAEILAAHSAANVATARAMEDEPEEQPEPLTGNPYIDARNQAYAQWEDRDE